MKLLPLGLIGLVIAVCVAVGAINVGHSDVSDWSTTAADNDDADSTIDFAENQTPASLNNSARALMQQIREWAEQSESHHMYAASTGVGSTVGSILITPSVVPAKLVSGAAYWFISPTTSVTNSGMKLSVASQAAATIFKSTNAELTSGDIEQNQLVMVVYDGNSFQLMTPEADAGATDVVDDTTPQLGGQLDVNGQAIGDGTRELLTFTEDGSAVNHVNIENEATGGGPIISPAGDDSDVPLLLQGKGTGKVQIGDANIAYPDSDGSANQVMKTDGSGTLSLAAVPVEETALTASSSTTFTGIPSSVSMIVVGLNTISLDGTDDLLLQIGDSGGIETSGYESASEGVSSTSGYVMSVGNASQNMSGHIILTNVSGNVWIASHSLGRTTTAAGITGGGFKTLTGTLDRLTLTATGSDAFDNGTLNIRYF